MLQELDKEFSCLFPPWPQLFASCGGFQVANEACAVLAAALTDSFPEAKRECCTLLLRLAAVCPGGLRLRLGKVSKKVDHDSECCWRQEGERVSRAIDPYPTVLSLEVPLCDFFVRNLESKGLLYTILYIKNI